VQRNTLILQEQNRASFGVNKSKIERALV